MKYSEYFDRYANHIIDTEFYAQAWEGKTERVLRKLRSRLNGAVGSYGSISSKTRYNQLALEVEGIVDEEIGRFGKKLDKEEEEQRKEEVDWLGRILKAAFGIAVTMSLFKMRKLKSQPFGKYGNLKDFTDSLRASSIKAVTIPAWSSYVFGTALSTVQAEMDRAFEKIEKDAKADVHLSVAENQRNTQRLLLEDNRGVEYVYVSMLDGSTCPVCGTYSGTRYKDLTNAPLLPLHHRCRCYYMPIKPGQECKVPTYTEWFESQPDSVKYNILGPSRYAFYKSGITFGEFTSNGRKLTLKELFDKTS